MIDSVVYSSDSQVFGHRISSDVLDRSNILDASGARICADESSVHPSWSGGRRGAMHSQERVGLCTQSIIDCLDSFHVGSDECLQEKGGEKEEDHGVRLVVR